MSSAATDRWPLTASQRDIYFDQLRHPGAALYNVGGYIRLGRVDVGRIRQAHEQLIRSEEIFGLRIASGVEGLGQLIVDERTTSLPYLDFSGCADPTREAQAAVDELFGAPLEMESSELFRARLVKIGDDELWYVGLAHHIAVDGWGFANWARELCRLYNGSAADELARPSWRSVSLDDEEYAAGEKYRRDREFWTAHLAGTSGKFLSPGKTSGKEAAGSSRRSGRVTVSLFDQAAAIRSLAASVGVGVPHVFLAAVACYIAVAEAARDRIVFGIPVHNRRTAAHKAMLAVFTGISPLAIEVSEAGLTVRELLQRISRQQRNAFRHQRYPMGQIMRDIGADPGERMFDIGFNYLVLDSKLSFDDRPADLVYVTHRQSVTPLMVTVWEMGAGRDIELQLDYSHSYFDERSARALSRRLHTLISALPQELHTLVKDLEIRCDDELPRTPTERELADLWARVTDARPAMVSVSEPLQDSAMTSSLIRLAEAASARWGVKLAPGAMRVRSPTLREIAMLIDADVALRAVRERRSRSAIVASGTL